MNVFVSAWGRICRMKHPILFLLIVGLVIRLLITTMAVQYDADYWARVIRNLRVEEGLYAMEGFYYTPVWGYILSFIGVIQNFFLDIGEYGVRVTEAIFMEYLPEYFISANITSLVFNYSVRIPLIISDLLLSLAVYWLVKDITGDDKKSLLALLLTFLSAHVAGCTCLTGMPDTFTALFMVLALIFMRRESNILAGSMFALSALTKFFPVFLFFVLCAYILRRNRDEPGKGIRELLKASIGASVTALLVYAPVISEGYVSRSIAFLLDRSSDIGDMVMDNIVYLALAGVAMLVLITVLFTVRSRKGMRFINLRNLGILAAIVPMAVLVGSIAIAGFDSILGSSRIALYLAVIIVSLLLAVRMYRDERTDIDRSLIWNCTLVLGLCMLYPPAPQYVVSLIPLLACYVATMGRGMVPWAILCISGFVFIPATNGSLLLTLAEWTDLISVDMAIGIFNAFQTSIGGVTLMSLIYTAGGIMQYIGLLLTVVTLLKDDDSSGRILGAIGLGSGNKTGST